MAPISAEKITVEADADPSHSSDTTAQVFTVHPPASTEFPEEKSFLRRPISDDDDSADQMEVNLLKGRHTTGTDTDTTDNNHNHNNNNNHHHRPHQPNHHHNDNRFDASTWKDQCKRRGSVHWCSEKLEDFMEHGGDPGEKVSNSEEKEIKKFCERKEAHEPDYKKAHEIAECQREETAKKLAEKVVGGSGSAYARKGTGPPAGLLIGGILGGLVLLAILGLLLFCCLSGSKKKKSHSSSSAKGKKSAKSARGKSKKSVKGKSAKSAKGKSKKSTKKSRR